MSVVLLAYGAAAVLGMIPITPGGLGFVEAGLGGGLTPGGGPAPHPPPAPPPFPSGGFRTGCRCPPAWAPTSRSGCATEDSARRRPTRCHPSRAPRPDFS